MSDFGSAKTKISIGSLDGGPTVTAQYNPKELQIDKSVPWSKVNEANKSNTGSDQSQGIHLEFTGAEGRTMSVELFFDGYEPNGNTVNVAQKVKDLETLASVIQPGALKEDLRRPHRCVVILRQSRGGSEASKCVGEGKPSPINTEDHDDRSGELLTAS